MSDEDYKTAYRLIGGFFLFLLPWLSMCCDCPNKTVTIDDSAIDAPARFYQRDADGTYDVPVFSIDSDKYRFNGGPWLPYDGSAINLPTGRNQIEFGRFDCSTTIGTIEDVIIGDVFLVAGQSNASGDGAEFQDYTGSGDSFQFDLEGNVEQLQDPTHVRSSGTPWPVVGSDIENQNNVPTFWIHTAQGGTRIENWVNGNGTLVTWGARSTVQADFSNINAIKRVVWYQGEGDVCGLATQEYYFDRLRLLADAFEAELPGNPTLIAGVIGDRNLCGDATTNDLRDVHLDLVRSALVQGADELPNVSLGAVTYAIGSDDGVHFRTDQQVQDHAHQWTNAIQNDCYGGTIENPRMVSVTKTSDATIQVVFDQPLVAGPTNAFTVESNGSDRTILSESASGSTVTITLAAPISSPCNVILAHGNSASVQSVPRNAADPLIVAVPFSETL